MPHIVFEKKDLIITPSQKDGVDFKFIAKSYNFTQKTRKIEYRIALEHENKEFLLSLKPKNDDFMIKADKVTRLSPVTLVKNALNAYVNLNNAKVLFSNTNNLKLKEEITNKYLKDINYFVDEFKTDKEIQIEIGFDGNMDSAITIRTTMLTADTIIFQAGAGVVADSKPEDEYLEVTNKLAANIATLKDLS